MFFLYNLVLIILTPLLILFFVSKKKAANFSNLSERMGFLPKEILPSPEHTIRIWIHAASVGEITASQAFIKMLKQEYPSAWIGLSTMTQSGLEIANANLPEIDSRFLVPFDLFFAARRAMQLIHPTIFITVETEIWPNLLRYAKRHGAQILMVNGRVSTRSIKMYQKLRYFFRKVLSYYEIFSVILPEDAQRLISMGATPERIIINGNIKYDRLAHDIKPEFYDEMRQKLNLAGDELILVAGSTREGEEELLLQALTKIKQVFPELILIIAPRHIQRGAEIARTITEYGFNPVMRTEITETTRITSDHVIVLNTIGELFKVYSLATIAFCGASLVPLGGQNPLEPAAWGKVVLYGPSMEDFLDAKALLEKAGSGIEIASPDQLATAVIELLQSDQLTHLGSAGQQIIQSQQGSSARNLELVKKIIVR